MELCTLSTNVPKSRKVSLELMERLMALGAGVDYTDPHVPALPRMRKYDFEKKSVRLTQETLCDYDLAVLATDHDQFDWEMIKANARLIVDTRGIYEADGKQIFRA